MPRARRHVQREGGLRKSDRRSAGIFPEADIWRAAVLIVKRYGDDAMLEASERADQLLDQGDMAGAETWHRILNAIERLQAKAPAAGEKVL